MARIAFRVLEVLALAAIARSLQRDHTGDAALVADPAFCSLGHKAPQFFLLGGPKCGTTYFFDAFAKSPGVALYKPDPTQAPFYQKEPWVFERQWDVKNKGAWLQHYPQCEAAWNKVAVDATPAYFGDRSAPSNIKAAYVPELRPRLVFMVFLRDPAIRSHSHYYQFRDRALAGEIAGCTPEQYPASFQVAAELVVNNSGVICDCDYDGIVNASMYADSFRRWFSLFEATQFHVVPFRLAIGEAIVQYTWRVLGMPPAAGGVSWADEAKNEHAYGTLEEELRPETLTAYTNFMIVRAGSLATARVLAGSGANLFQFTGSDTAEGVQAWLKSNW